MTKLSIRLFAAAVLFLLTESSVIADPAHYVMSSVTLLQPDETVSQRLPDGAASLAAYIQAINAAVAAALVDDSPPPAAGVALFLALRPNGTSNAWIGTKSDIPMRLRDTIIGAARAVKPPAVTGGTIVFAISVSLSGGPAPGGADITLPSEWHTDGSTTEITALVDSIWKN